MLFDIYMLCAIVGGAVVIAQLLLSLVAGLSGAGHGLRLHHRGVLAHRMTGGGRAAGGASRGMAARSSATARPAVHGVRSALHQHWAVYYLLGIFNFQGMVAGLAVLGLAGLAASAARLPSSASLAIACAAALLMMALVAAVLRFMVSMDQDGTVQLDQAVGQIGTVYLTIPPAVQGHGKVTLTLQQRLMEFAAVTQQDTPLPTGRKVIVIAVRKPAVMEVVSADERVRDLESLAQSPAAPR